MTKVEAIAMFKRIQEPEAWEPQINQAAFEALDMAIEALSQESSEDVISRAGSTDRGAENEKEGKGMTAEEKCSFLKQIMQWSKSTQENECLYMEEGLYFVKAPDGVVVLVEANSPKEAVMKARRPMFVQNGSNNYQIHNVGTITI